MKNKIGTYLRQHREENHLTLEQVAEHTGIREPTWRLWKTAISTRFPGMYSSGDSSATTETIWDWTATDWWRPTGPAVNRKRS